MGNSHDSSVPFLADLENEYAAAEKSDASSRDSPKTTKSSKAQTYLWISCIIVITLLSNTATYLITHRFKENLEKACAKHTAQYLSELPKFHDPLKHMTYVLTVTGPILDNTDIKYETVRFNGSLFTNTIYREDPSPEVDEAWLNLGIKCMSSISISQSTKANTNIRK